MINLLKAQYYKLLHKQSFWGLLLFSLVLGSLLLLDSRNTTADLLKGSLYNLPQMYFIPLIFTALFVGEDFESRTIHCLVSAGHTRGAVFFTIALSCLTACTALYVLPLLFHYIAAAVLGQNPSLPFGALLLTLAAILAMGMLPLLFVFLFRDTGKAFAIPMVLFFLMIFVLNSSYAPAASIVLPMGQLRLLALDEVTFPVWLPLGIDCFWIVLSCLIACGSFCRSELK